MLPPRKHLLTQGWTRAKSTRSGSVISTLAWWRMPSAPPWFLGRIRAYAINRQPDVKMRAHPARRHFMERSMRYGLGECGWRSSSASKR